MADEPRIPIYIARLPVSVPCPVPVLPGTPNTHDDLGNVIPMDARSEACAVDAFWMIGMQITCDLHLREALPHLGLDYVDVAAEAGGPFESDSYVWEDRKRASQDDAKRLPPWTDDADG